MPLKRDCLEQLVARSVRNGYDRQDDELGRPRPGIVHPFCGGTFEINAVWRRGRFTHGARQ